MKSPISAIILTFNEEKNLPKCLESIKDLVDEIIVVDSGSTDATKEIAEKYGARFVEHPFVNQAEQFNWALDNVPIKNEWILRLDADEYLTQELNNEIRVHPLINDVNPRPSASTINGFYMKRRVYFMGRWIRHGGYYPTWILRIFRKGKGRSEDREMDEHIFLSEGATGKLQNDFVDDNKKGLSDWVAKHNNYSTREARERLKPTSNLQLTTYNSHNQAATKRQIKNNFYLKLPLFIRPFMYFTYRYIFRLGFLDGIEGLIFHFLQACWHQFLIDAKIYEQKNVQKI